jgi:hypothetical protein
VRIEFDDRGVAGLRFCPDEGKRLWSVTEREEEAERYPRATFDSVISCFPLEIMTDEAGDEPGVSTRLPDTDMSIEMILDIESRS